MVLHFRDSFTFVTVNAGLRLPIVSNIVLFLAARCGSVCTFFGQTTARYTMDLTPDVLECVDRVALAVADRVRPDAEEDFGSYSMRQMQFATDAIDDHTDRIHMMILRLVTAVGPDNIDELTTLLVSSLILMERYIRQTTPDNSSRGPLTVQTLFLTFLLLCVKMEDDWVVTNLFHVMHWWTGIPKKSLVAWERHVCEALGFRLEIQDATFQAYAGALQAILLDLEM